MLLSGSLLVGGTVLASRYTGGINQGDLLDEGVQTRKNRLDPTKPVNMLLVGIDTRPDNTWEPIRSDSIILAHIPPGHNRVYLVSIPRDLIVEIPASDGRRAGRDRINAAFPLASKDGRDITAGFKLLSRTVTDFTGLKFDAGVIINFEGFQAVVKALGGVQMCVDDEVESEHIGIPPGGGQARKIKPGDKPVKYPVGCYAFNDWQALDYVRQRYTVEGGDYGRQRNQQKFIKALVQAAVSKGVITDPPKLDSVVRAAGKALTLDSGGIPPAEWAWGLRDIRPNGIVMVRTPGGGVGVGENYQGEELQPVGLELLAAMRESRMDEFMIGHPELISQ